jgi:HK97 gp10 family phage protein
MASDQTTVTVQGLDHLKSQLAAITRTLRRRVLRNALAAGAREIRNEASRLAPVLTVGQARRVPYRTPGTVRKAISVRTSKRDTRAGNVGVFVNVKPLPGNKWKKTTYRTFFGGRRTAWQLLKKTERSAQNPNDPFYWRFLEFGTRYMRARPFLQPAADKLPQALTVFQSELARWITKVNSSGNPNTP